MTKHVRVEFYVSGFDELPEVHAERLGISPDNVTTKGVIYTNRKLPAKWNVIEIASDLEEEVDINSHICNIMKKLGHLQKLREKLEESRNMNKEYDVGINVTIYVAEGDYSPKCPMFIENETLKKIADLGCEMDFGLNAPPFRFSKL